MIHGDHNKSMKDFERSGCEMLTYETLEPKVQYWYYEHFKIITYPILHNVSNFGIIIQSLIDNEKICYMTDFVKAPKIEGCDKYIFEVNYIDAYIDEMIEENKELKHNNFLNHQSLESAVDYFSELKTHCKEIICFHLSANNSIKSRILNAMQPFADKVSIAENWRDNGKRI